VEIGDEEETLIRFALKIQIRLDRTEIISQVQLAGGLNAGEDA